MNWQPLEPARRLTVDRQKHSRRVDNAELEMARSHVLTRDVATCGSSLASYCSISEGYGIIVILFP